jgi:hypothetical protein
MSIKEQRGGKNVKSLRIFKNVKERWKEENSLKNIFKKFPL